MLHPRASNAAELEATRSKQALDQLATLPNLALLQLLPPLDRANLDADHVLVAVVGREVAHSLCLLDPRVPGDCVLDVVADDVEAGHAVLEDGGCVLWDSLVDAVDLAGELDGVVLLLVGSRVEDLVDVLGARQAGDADLGDVLAKD
jgi:hypothetical protein